MRRLCCSDWLRGLVRNLLVEQLRDGGFPGLRDSGGIFDLLAHSRRFVQSIGRCERLRSIPAA